jgi:hypothetical protein
MPYEITDYTNFIYPLKLHEYLAAGRPVIATPIDSVVQFADVVTLATTVDEWQIALEAALGEDANSHEAVVARQSRAAEHDWDLLVDRIAVQLRQSLCGPAYERASPDE